MKDTSTEFAVFAERAYKTFLELLRHELQKNRVNDINAIQVFMLLNIDEGIITMSEILSKGYYSGSNASYNLKKMLQNGYLTSTPSSIDKRSQYLSLSDKGHLFAPYQSSFFAAAPRTLKLLFHSVSFWQYSSLIIISVIFLCCLHQSLFSVRV